MRTQNRNKRNSTGGGGADILTVNNEVPKPPLEPLRPVRANAVVDLEDLLEVNPAAATARRISTTAGDLTGAARASATGAAARASMMGGPQEPVSAEVLRAATGGPLPIPGAGGVGLMMPRPPPEVERVICKMQAAWRGYMVSFLLHYWRALGLY
jgi:hypothetical protein